MNRRHILPRSVVLCVLLLFQGSCGYRFGAARAESPFPPELKTISVESAVNKTTVTGIETELTNDLRLEFALGTVLQQINSGGDISMHTEITSYEDVPAIYKADGKELTRIGTLKAACTARRTDTQKVLWEKKNFEGTQSYTVTDSIGGTLTNRRRAISLIIKDLVPRIHRSLYDSF